MDTHKKLFGPLSEERGEEPDTLLRLRKVYCHVGMVTSWLVDKWAIHVMAPDIRAALEQLRPLVRGGVCTEAHDREENCQVPQCFDKFDNIMTPYAHPTGIGLSVVLRDGPDFEHIGARCLFELRLVLEFLITSYHAGIAASILQLSDSAEQEMLAVRFNAFSLSLQTIPKTDFQN